MNLREAETERKYTVCCSKILYETLINTALIRILVKIVAQEVCKD